MPSTIPVRFAATLFFGTMAGFFFAYSATVSPGLSDADPDVALRAMQAVNASVRNPAFGFAFWGAHVTGLAVGLEASARRRGAWCFSWR